MPTQLRGFTRTISQKSERQKRALTEKNVVFANITERDQMVQNLGWNKARSSNRGQEE